MSIGLATTRFQLVPGGKVLEILTAPLLRSLAFRAILSGCAKELESQ